MPSLSNRAPLINVLRGIVPVASSWDTDPTTLANCTDGDFTTATGEGSTNKVGAGIYGNLVFDMGVSRTVLVGGKVGIYSQANAVYVGVAASANNITYSDEPGNPSNAYVAEYASGGEAVVYLLTKIVTGRYIKVFFWVSAAANTAKAKIYEIVAYDLGV